MLRLGILGSTKGTDLEAIITAIQKGTLNAKINLVVSNKENALLLKRAENNNIKKEFISCLLYTSPSPRDQRGSRMPSCG